MLLNCHTFFLRKEKKKMIKSDNEQISWSSEFSTLEFRTCADGSSLTIDLDKKPDLWDTIIQAFNKMWDYIEDWENGHYSTYEEKNKHFTINLQDCNSETLLNFFYHPENKSLRVSISTEFGKFSVDIDLNIKNTWKTWLEILRQMKRDYKTRHPDTSTIFVYDIKNEDNEGDDTDDDKDNDSDTETDSK